MSNILVIKHGSLGDLIQANGAIKDIKEHSLIDHRYLTLLENIKDGILSVNKDYACGMYIADRTSRIFDLKSSSEEIFNSNVELNNPLLRSVFDEKKSIQT